ncbi:MAG: hypothetical protein Q9157_007524 [Trypethelium eluteriae]
MDDNPDTSPAESPNTLKRKGEDNSSTPNPPQQRAKRNRYISIAWEFKQMNAHIASLQGQVEILFSNLSELRSTMSSDTPSTSGLLYSHSHQDSLHSTSASHSRAKSASKHPRFQGPTSSAFSLGVAKSSLQTMGITGPEDGVDDGALTQDGTPMASPGHRPKPLHPDKDPIYSISKEEAVRLCHVYEEEMGVMYPVMNISLIIRHANLLYTFMDAATRAGVIQTSMQGADAISDDKTNMLKMTLALALTCEGSGQSVLGQRLYESVRDSVEAMLFGPADLMSLRVLTLCAMYHFQCDSETLAWRLIGFSTRLCMELGLHRHETYDVLFTDPNERASIVRLFWAIYVLDRRWAFGTGMPFVLQDGDIDPALDKPGDSSPYLMAMIAYSNIGSKVWRSVANVDNNRQDVNQEEIGYLDYQIIQWHRSIPESLKYIHPGTGKEPENITRSVQRLRIVLYLRANQMRILIYRPVLHSATSIMENRSHAQTVVDVAKDTVRVLTHVNQTSDIYRTQQVLFNYFLISALAVIFLAVSHAPAQFSSHCRDEFYMALDLVRGFSATSWVSKRLWRTIRELKQVGPKLGLVLRQSAVDNADAHSSAAVAMAGLAGHQIDEMTLYGNHAGNHMVNSPNGMANDLTNLFEAAGGFSSLLSSNGGSSSMNGYSVTQNGDNGSAGFGGDDELSRIMKDLF